MQDYQYQNLTNYNDCAYNAYSYMDEVKYTLRNQPEVYNEFLDTMTRFKYQCIDLFGLIQRISNLFWGHPDLIVGFNRFLPPEYRIQVHPNEQVPVNMPDTILDEGWYTTEPTSLILQGESPSASPLYAAHSQSNHWSHATLPYPSPGNAANILGTQTQEYLPQDLNILEAGSYMDQVKYTFINQPEVYNDFLDTMKEFTSQRPNTLGVMQRISTLFRDHPDLIHGFNKFLPHGYRIKPNVQFPMNMAGTNLGGVFGSTVTTDFISPGAHIQDLQSRNLTLDDAFSYVNQVKYTFGEHSQVVNDFVNIIIEFKCQRIDTLGLVQSVSDLFRGHPELILSLNPFLLPSHRIEIQPNGQVAVIIPGTNLGEGTGSTGSTSLFFLPSGPERPPPSYTTHSQSDYWSYTAAPHLLPESAVNEADFPTTSNHTFIRGNSRYIH